MSRLNSNKPDRPFVLACYPVSREFPDGGGVGHRVRRILTGIRESHGIRSACLRLERDFPTENDHSDMPVFYYSTRENRFAVIRRLASCVPSDVSVMFLNGEPLEYEVAHLLRRQRGVRCVSVVCTDSPHYYRIAEKYGGIIDMHLALTRATGEHIRHRLGSTADIRVIHTGVARPDSLPAVGPGAASRADTRLRLIYVGRVVEAQKAVSRLLDVMAGLRDLGVPSFLTIVGDGPDKSALETAFIKKGLADSVHFTGHLDRDGVSCELRRASAFLLTSATEGLSNALLEAMAHGCVPLVMEMPGIREVVQDGRNGFVVPQGDCSAMAERVIQLAKDREQLCSMSRNAYGTIGTSFNVERMVDDYASLFHELHQKGPFRGPVPMVPCSASRLDQPWIPNWLTLLLRRGLKALKS